MRAISAVTFSTILIVGLFMTPAQVYGQTPADAQTPTVLGPPYFDSAVQFWSGQDVVPTFDGWMQNSDGIYTLVFG